VDRDPGGAIGWKQLASSYLAASVDRDDNELAIKAEHAAKKSLELRRSNNAPACLVLTSSYLQQHRFGDALKACLEAQRLEPGADAVDRQLSDIYMELGQTAKAEPIMKKHPEWLDDSSGLVLLARHFEETGKTRLATRLLTKAVLLADARYDFTQSAVAWYHVRLADHVRKFGNPKVAYTHYQTALEYHPTSWKAFAGLARNAYAQKDWKQVLKWGDKLNAVSPMTDVVGMMQDAARNLGDQKLATKYETQVKSMNAAVIENFKPGHHDDKNSKQPKHTHDRQLSEYLVRENSMLELAHHIAEEDLKSRSDLYSWDTFAWATFQFALSENRAFELKESEQAIDRALAFGTQDPKILYHAAKIKAKLGKTQLARKYADLALAVNPQWDLAEAKDAKEVLAKL
jgi:tetratricopeptide (TPR) repeat protein